MLDFTCGIGVTNLGTSLSNFGSAEGAEGRRQLGHYEPELRQDNVSIMYAAR